MIGSKKCTELLIKNFVRIALKTILMVDKPAKKAKKDLQLKEFKKLHSLYCQSCCESIIDHCEHIVAHWTEAFGKHQKCLICAWSKIGFSTKTFFLHYGWCVPQ